MLRFLVKQSAICCCFFSRDVDGENVLQVSACMLLKDTTSGDDE